jgi:hypothetical protein
LRIAQGVVARIKMNRIHAWIAMLEKLQWMNLKGFLFEDIAE